MSKLGHKVSFSHIRNNANIDKPQSMKVNDGKT